MPRDVVYGGPGNDHVSEGDGNDKVLGEEGFNTVVDVVRNDGDRDTIFCGWPEEQNYGRVFYSAPTSTQLDITPSTPTSGPLYFGDNVKCCSIWTKDPDTGVETKLAEGPFIKCTSARIPARD